MVQETYSRRELEPAHHVARYCRPRYIREDGTLAPSAFRIRPGEEFLSANWLEYFHDSERSDQISGVRQALAGKGFRVSGGGSFAVLNVADSTAVTRDNLNIAIQFIVLGETHDPSHAGIFGYTAENSAVIAVMLAQSVNPNEIYPAAA